MKLQLFKIDRFPNACISRQRRSKQRAITDLASEVIAFARDPIPHVDGIAHLGCPASFAKEIGLQEALNIAFFVESPDGLVDEKGLAFHIVMFVVEWSEFD
jgi:hypothetical protein